MRPDNEHIDNLIAKYLAGETSEQENAEVQQWMDLSPENLKYFEGIRFIHQKAVSSHPYIKVDTDKAWNKLHTQIVEEQTPALGQTKTLSNRTWLTIAAGIVLVIGISALFYWFSSVSAKIETIASSQTTVKRTLGNTQVVLNRNSKLTFSQKSAGRSQEIKLEGEAYFEVHHSKDTILVVKAEETLIRDIGTEFNVRSYPQSSTIEVFVKTGEVAFYTKYQEGLILKKGETGIYNKKLKQFSRLNTGDMNIIAYKTRSFIFNHTTLENAVKAINDVYPRSIILKTPAIANCDINVTFNNESLDAMVEILSETLGLQVTKSGEVYELSGRECSNP